MLAFQILARTSARRTVSLGARSFGTGRPLAWVNSGSQQRRCSPAVTNQRIFLGAFQHSLQQPSSSLSSVVNKHQNRLFSAASSDDSDSQSSEGIFANPEITFESMGIQSPILLDRIKKLGLTRPTAVQAATFDVLSDDSPSRSNVTLGSETGSGKTLAYLLPLLDDILQRKQQLSEQPLDTEENDVENDDGENDIEDENYLEGDNGIGYAYARALILVPNKELVQQVARMAMALSGGRASLIGGGVAESMLEGLPKDDTTTDKKDVVRIAIMPGSLKEPKDFPPFRKSLLGQEDPVDLVISTPAAVGPMALSPKNINMFADIGTVVCDEADMLLDGGYIRPLEQVLLGFRRADKLDKIHGIPKTQHVFVAATLPDYGLRSVDAYLNKKFPNTTKVTLDGMHNARHYGLSQPTLWVELESKKERLQYFENLLEDPPEEGGLQGQKVMLFVNTVDDVEGVSRALEDKGIRALPYHAKMSLSERTENLDRFRRFQAEGGQSTDAVPILVCTDLASRGVDIPDVHAIVQLQFAGNVVAHLHRMGRCGRAGQRTGRGIVFFNEKERELIEVVTKAEEQQETMTLKGQDVLEVELDEDGDVIKPGTVKKAFSRKRGFTKKRKKERRESNVQ